MTSLIIVSILCFVLAVVCVLQRVRAVKHSKIINEYKKDLEKKVEEQWKQLEKKKHDFMKMQDAVIEGMATIVEYRDLNTGMHVKNTKKYVLMLAQYLYDNGLHSDVVDQKFLSLIGNAAAMHDLGKIAVSDRILNKPARLDDEEFEIMKTHTVVGAGLVRQVFGKTVDQDMLRMCVNVVQYHHEKWDGTGYPIGLAGTKIPLCARIMAIADVFDALVSKRIYKDSIPIEEVFEIIRESAGTQFDPELAEIFLGLRDQICDYIIENSEQMTSARKTVDSDGDDRVHDVVELEDLEEVV